MEEFYHFIFAFWFMGIEPDFSLDLTDRKSDFIVLHVESVLGAY